jgi:hypothetical protein
MPPTTRQATPGASTVLQDADPNAGAKKKRGAPPDEDGLEQSPRDPKKLKTDPSGSRGGGKGKRRKKKRKVSIVSTTTGLSQDSRPRSRSKSTPAKTPMPEMPLTQEDEDEILVEEELEGRVDDPVQEADPSDSAVSPFPLDRSTV